MNRFIKGILVAVMTLALGACASTGQTEVKSADDTQQESALAQNTEEKGEKVLNMALFWLDGNLEPTESWNGWALTRAGIGENLIQVDENMKFKNVIAESYKQVDDLTTVFNIREGVTFHNGKTVDAEACKASIERALEISNREDVKFPVDEITAEGYTLTIKTSEPYATLINNLSDPVFIIVDAEAAAENDNFKFAPITTGAFKVTSFDKDTGMTLEKHEGHWSGDIGVDKVNVKYIQDGATRTMALQSGEIDLATQINSNDLTLFEDDDNFIVQKGPNLRVFLLRLNMDKPYMADLKFRQAVRMGMNKEIYAEEIAHGTAAKGPFNDMLSFGYKDADAYSYDPEQAKALLSEAGYVDTDGDGIREANGENIVMKYVSRTNHGSDANDIGIAMQAQLKEIGLSLEVLQVENYKDMAASGDFDMLYERWTSAPSADGQYFLSSGYETGSAGNYGHYSNPDLDAICEALVTEFDKEERDMLSIEGSKILMEDVGTLFLFYQQGNVVTNKKVSGVERFISEIYYIDNRVEVN